LRTPEGAGGLTVQPDSFVQPTSVSTENPKIHLHHNRFSNTLKPVVDEERMSLGISEIARHLNLSKTTVSRVANGVPNAGISSKTRQRVLDAIERMGYRPNVTASALAGGKTHVVAFIGQNSNNPLSSDMVWAMETVARRNGYHVILCNTRGDADIEREEIRMLRQRGIEGMVIEHQGSSDKIRELIDGGFPVVLLDRCEDLPGVDYVTFDDVEGGRLATQALIDGGRRRIAHIGGPLSSLPARDRLEGYRVAVQSAGLPLVAEWQVEASLFEDVSAGRAAAERLFSCVEKPDAIFCASDHLALGVFQAAAAHSVVVPRDVALIGYDDHSLCPWTAVPLASIRLDFKQLGDEASRLLFEKIKVSSVDDRRSPVSIKIPPQLVARASLK
jgi:LacI family transcriptional regulator